MAMAMAKLGAGLAVVLTTTRAKRTRPRGASATASRTTGNGWPSWACCAPRRWPTAWPGCRPELAGTETGTAPAAAEMGTVPISKMGDARIPPPPQPNRRRRDPVTGKECPPPAGGPKKRALCPFPEAAELRRGARRQSGKPASAREAGSVTVAAGRRAPRPNARVPRLPRRTAWRFALPRPRRRGVRFLGDASPSRRSRSA